MDIEMRSLGLPSRQTVQTQLKFLAMQRIAHTDFLEMEHLAWFR